MRLSYNVCSDGELYPLYDSAYEWLNTIQIAQAKFPDDRCAAFGTMRTWGQTVLTAAGDLRPLALKHAVAHLILANEMQVAPALGMLPETPRNGRISAIQIRLPVEAIELTENAGRPSNIVGHGARFHGRRSSS